MGSVFYLPRGSGSMTPGIFARTDLKLPTNNADLPSSPEHRRPLLVQFRVAWETKVEMVRQNLPCTTGRHNPSFCRITQTWPITGLREEAKFGDVKKVNYETVEVTWRWGCWRTR